MTILFPKQPILLLLLLLFNRSLLFLLLLYYSFHKQTTTTSMQPSTEMTYQNPPIINEDGTAVPIGTTITPTTTKNTGHRLSKRMIAIIVAGALMLVPYGAVLLWDGDTAAEDLVVGTGEKSNCVSAVGTFGGKSTTTYFGENTPFKTCYQFGNVESYCWTQSFTDNGYAWFQCGPIGSLWNSVDPKFLNPVTHPYSCGKPCQDIHLVQLL